MRFGDVFPYLAPGAQTTVQPLGTTSATVPPQATTVSPSQQPGGPSPSAGKSRKKAGSTWQ